MSAADYARKIKTREELQQIVRARRDSGATVILAHGTFDVVHPGHLRHLEYAKSKANVLIASLTADRHIDKGAYRPHVPEDLRARSLAALEMVDFVMIDSEATPINTIAMLQPDFFAKGFDYSGADAPKTQAEIAELAVYGGQIIFTPGDVTYSSSALIELAPPSLKYEKLLIAMERAELSFDDLRHCLGWLKGWRVHLIGDLIVDSYTQTSMVGGMSKTPTMSVRYEKRTDFVGGAGVVAKHLAAAGALVSLSTIIGNDQIGRDAITDLEKAGIGVHEIVDETRPTTQKNAIVCDGYRLLKIDTVDNRSISDAAVQKFCSDMDRLASSAVVMFSDFRHGIFNRRTIPALTEAIRAPFRVADSQVASRWGNILDFQGFNLITPNEREARFAMGDQDSGVQALASRLHDEAHCKTLMLKLGERGLMTSRGSSSESFIVLDSLARKIVDAVGSGDALLAYATLALRATGDRFVASILGSIAAALECEQEGNVPITPDMMLARIDELEKEANYGNGD